MKITNILNCKWVGLLLAGILLWSCEKKDNGPDIQGNVALSSPTIEPGGSLSINATARFDVEVSDVPDSITLIYEWTLLESRSTLIINNAPYDNPVKIYSPYVNVRGDKAGEETIRVSVYSEASGNSLGEDELTFEITEPSGTSHCYVEPMLFYRDNNWENPRMTELGLESGTIKSTHLDPDNWLMDLSHDGNWFIREDFTDVSTYVIYLVSCDGSESKLLTDGRLLGSPTFGPNDKYVYFTESVYYPEQPQDPRAREIFRLNIETQEKVPVSDFGVFSEYPKVSPDGKWIAFVHGKETFNANGTYAGSIDHMAIMPGEGGPAQFLFNIGEGEVRDLDWSPDSKDLIFHWNMPGGSTETRTDGIYRVYIDGGGAPSLIFAEPGANNTTLAYYANGTRIAFHGHPAGDDTQYDIWSIDANGNDLQRITDEKYNVFLQFIWEP